MNIDSIGACGDWCGKCPHFRRECRGCRSKAGECKFVKCLAGRALDHCGLCSEFPCKDLESFVPDNRLPRGYHIESLRYRNEVGAEKWLERYSREWRHLVR